MSDLEERTRWEPADAEREIFERWLESGLFHVEPEGTASENFSIAIPAWSVPSVQRVRLPSMRL